MLEYESARSLLEIALAYSTADQTEIILEDSASGLTRLANGGIHQNVAMAGGNARVRAVLGARSGVATGNQLSADALKQLVDQALAIARMAEPNTDGASLPAPRPIVPVPTPAADADDFTPERRADLAKVLIQTGAAAGVCAAGRVATAMRAYAIGNSLGVRAYHRVPGSSVMSIMTDGDASGYAIWDGGTLRDAPAGEVAARAAGICRAARDPQPLEPGHYTVILEPPAVAEMLAMLAVMGLGADAYQEGRSFMSGKVGAQLVAEQITLRDDAYAPGMIPLPFDFEGMPRQVVPFFERGVAKGVVYDTCTAHKAGPLQRSTGHALPAPNASGPLPLHLVLDRGSHSRDALIRGVQRGVVVTRFHYVSIVHPRETLLTGMTRDGAFLIEDGVVSKPVKNLRFTQSILDALRRVSGLENRQHLIDNEGMYCLTPTLRIEEFAFTS